MLDRPRESGGQATPRSLTPAPAPRRSTAERLEELKALREQRLITEDEYQAKRRAILEGL